MKSFAAIITISSLLFCLFSCDTGKSGPFTFTNKTGLSVNVIIIQDGTVEKTFSAGEQYTGKDYYTPRITFVKGLDSADNKKIIDNRYTYTTTSTFDYVFEKATSTPINISASLPSDFATTYPDYGKWYLAEVNGKLGSYSETTILFEKLLPASSTGASEASNNTTPPVASETLYTSNPQFRIYRDKTVEGKTEREDLTNLFSLFLGKIEPPPATDAAAAPSTPQWNLVITYPKVEPVE